MTSKASTPILTSVYNICGILALVATFIGVITTISRIQTACVVAFVGLSVAIIYFGIAQAVAFLGRTAHATERLCDLMENRGSLVARSPAAEKSVSLQPYEDPFEKWQREQNQKKVEPDGPPKV